jgi:multimeric flavodoxin WrbA
MKSFSLYITESTSSSLKKNLEKTINFLETKNKVLFLTTSNRSGLNADDIPKSTQLAHHIQELVGMKKIEIIEVPKLNIYICEGNVSSAKGNGCGKKEAVLKNEEKNPSGYHRCWCSLNHKDDELWKISKSLFQSDCVVFFGSVRWGQTNSVYQKLIERLCWIENRHTTLKESNIVKDICAGIILTGQNWNGENVIETQKQVLKFYGFDVQNDISWNWQYTNNANDESKESYKKAIADFQDQLI